MSTRPPGHAAIVRAARAEFAERGYGATSIRDIAQRAGVSLSALYYYYKGKQDLLVAILDDAQDAYFSSCEQALAEAGEDPAEQLEALVEATVRYRSTHASKSNILLSEERSLEPEHLERYRADNARSTRRFRDIIERGVQDGLFLTPYPDDARRAVIAMCNAVAQWYEPGGALSEDDLVERYVSLALTAVEYRPRAPRRASRTQA
ncbi:TetR/AcrR family transcriptional regulator [Streptomyces cavernicola]|uniref:TetR/AcrR family transcriptional regulator n=1 Tax=Streptomyces cavernicola TaxID=3043613 RepID=A0ABT6SFG4_9ACTN|nr:TetR/AcrR family transcriptional regulator [Streptomyces sp. B-S-A6]MDI3406940.1 TetR/AcrR family transcriptional regulator [Streptomyces sp. B-S-A6]